MSIISLDIALSVFRVSLTYFLASAVVGFLLGAALSRISFAQHTWTADLLKGKFVFARVLLDKKFSVEGEAGEYMIAIEGFLRDAYFGDDGSLIYLVFSEFREGKVPLTKPPYIKASFPSTGDRFGIETEGLTIKYSNTDGAAISSWHIITVVVYLGIYSIYKAKGLARPEKSVFVPAMAARAKFARTRERDFRAKDYPPAALKINQFP